MSYFIQSHTETGLWDAFHDAEILSFKLDSPLLVFELLADFPNPPQNAAEKIGLSFGGVTGSEFWQANPVGDPCDEIWEYVPYSLSEFLTALDADSPAYLGVAGVTVGNTVTFGFEVLFMNLPLYVVGVIRASSVEVTADGRPSSFDEWMAWGMAGWDKFGSKE